jgi:integrase
MSVHKRNGRWQVKWREGERQRSRTFDLKGDADMFDRELGRRKALGPALVGELTRPTFTLADFVQGGFRMHSATLAAATREQYAWALNTHLADLLDTPLSEINVPRLAALQQRLLDSGRTPHTVRTALTMLSGVLTVAVQHGHITANPVRDLRKVSVERRDEIRPLAPAELEALIASLKGRDRAIALLGGHLGLRPIEIRSVLWGALGEGTLTIGRARTKKTAARTRVIAVPSATMAELKRWRLESGRPGDDQPIIGPMTSYNLKAFGNRKLGPLAETLLGRDDVTVYALRHAHASALHYAGWTVPAAARRLGHGPALHVTHYAHVIDALEGQPHHADLDALIAIARAEVPSRFPKLGDGAAGLAL